MYFDYLTDNSAIIRIFPLEDYSKYEDPNKIEEYKIGIIYINGNDIEILKDEKDINKLFNYIPSDSSSEYVINNELKNISVKPIKLNILGNN